jgi:branched-chain amino acid transport system ATP-binding protein
VSRPAQGVATAAGGGRSSTNQPLLEVVGLTAAYDFLQVLWGIDVQVQPGEFVAILGPNGAGKTTTLRSIVGLLRPRDGMVRFRGQEITGLSADRISRLGIALVTETLNLFPAMTVWENLLVGAHAVRNRRERDEALELVFDLFPRLRERHRQLAGTLSGGERKMLAVGRGLMSRPSLLLLDEPSLGLAPIPTVALFEALQRLRGHGLTVLLVEQNVNTTLRLVDRAYVLEQGRIVLHGTGTELLANPHVQQAYLGV